MTTAKLDFLNRAHIKKKLSSGNVERHEMAKRLSGLLSEIHSIDWLVYRLLSALFYRLTDHF